MLALSFTRLVTIAALTFCLLPTVASSSPTAVDSSGDSVEIVESGLTWKRCAEGQAWNGTTCAGNAVRFNATQAKALTKAGWRVPTIGELSTLIQHDRNRPAANVTLFPGTPSAHFWSSTPSKAHPNNFWAVNFGNGAIYTSRITKYFHVRLVRGSLRERTYIDLGNGTLALEPGNLIWKRCAEGQSWAGSTCLGNAANLTWNEAMKIAADGWRIPTLEELASLVEWSKSHPAIDTALFPSTPASAFWSATVANSSSKLAWSIDFQDGYTDTSPQLANRHVRLVRNEAPLPQSRAELRLLAERVFNWAEKSHAEYFYPAGQPTQEAQGYLFRYYPSTGLYLAVKDGRLWLVGPFNNEQIRDAGSLGRRFSQAKAAGF